jgi:hypothetical protein
MPAGGGKYDAEMKTVMAATGGEVVCVIVIEGNRGSGFAVGCNTPERLLGLPRILRDMADSIDRDLEGDGLEVKQEAKPCPN